MSLIGVAARGLWRESEKVCWRSLAATRHYSTGDSTPPPPKSSAKPAEPKPKPAAEKPKPVVEAKPDISTYKVKEYFSHGAYAFYDIDTDMKNDRLDRQSSLS